MKTAEEEADSLANSITDGTNVDDGSGDVDIQVDEGDDDDEEEPKEGLSAQDDAQKLEPVSEEEENEDDRPEDERESKDSTDSASEEEETAAAKDEEADGEEESKEGLQFPDTKVTVVGDKLFVILPRNSYSLEGTPGYRNKGIS